jgi:hypothetical protein
MFFDKEVDIPKENAYLSKEELYKMAKKRVNIKKGFAIHAGVYFVVNFFLFAMNILTFFSNDPDGRYPWFLWPVLGWGIGLGCHYISMVAILKFDLKDSALQREIDHLYKNFNRDK